MACWQTSDKKFGEFGGIALRASRQAWYLDRRHKTDVQNFVSLVKRALPYFHKYVDLPEGVTVRLAGIKSRTTRGNWTEGSKMATIDYRNKFADMVGTLAHEFVHGEQYLQGRLRVGTERGTYGVQYWHGDAYKGKEKNKFARYLNQPWEIEARERQFEIANKVWCDMYDDDTVSIQAIANNVGILWLKKKRPEIYEAVLADEAKRVASISERKKNGSNE